MHENNGDLEIRYHIQYNIPKVIVCLWFKLKVKSKTENIGQIIRIRSYRPRAGRLALRMASLTLSVSYTKEQRATAVLHTMVLVSRVTTHGTLRITRPPTTILAL